MTDSMRESFPEDRSPSAQWVVDMHVYFRENGFFRPADLRRLLGDPTDHVQVQASTDLTQLARFPSMRQPSNDTFQTRPVPCTSSLEK